VTFEGGLNVSAIGHEAFSGCSSLLSISIPSSVRTSLLEDLQLLRFLGLSGFGASSNGLHLVRYGTRGNSLS
jgi:hypothetical protein